MSLFKCQMTRDRIHYRLLMCVSVSDIINLLYWHHKDAFFGNRHQLPHCNQRCFSFQLHKRIVIENRYNVFTLENYLFNAIPMILRRYFFLIQLTGLFSVAKYDIDKMHLILTQTLISWILSLFEALQKYYR